MLHFRTELALASLLSVLQDCRKYAASVMILQRQVKACYCTSGMQGNLGEWGQGVFRPAEAGSDRERVGQQTQQHPDESKQRRQRRPVGISPTSLEDQPANTASQAVLE